MARHAGQQIDPASAATLRRAHAAHPITALQTEYSLWSRGPEDALLPTVRELGIGYVAYSPLGCRFLTGQIKRVEDLEPDDYRRQAPRFQGENFQRNLDLLKEIRAIGIMGAFFQRFLGREFWLVVRGLAGSTVVVDQSSR